MTVGRTPEEYTQAAPAGRRLTLAAEDKNDDRNRVMR